MKSGLDLTFRDIRCRHVSEIIQRYQSKCVVQFNEIQLSVWARICTWKRVHQCDSSFFPPLCLSSSSSFVACSSLTWDPCSLVFSSKKQYQQHQSHTADEVRTEKNTAWKCPYLQLICWHQRFLHSLGKTFQNLKPNQQQTHREKKNEVILKRFRSLHALIWLHDIVERQ